MQQPDQPGPPALGCKDCPMRCAWNLLPSILALSILILFTFIGNDTIAKCTVRIDKSAIQQLLIWQFYLLLEFAGVTKILLIYFKSKGLEHSMTLTGAAIALISPLANFALMFKFPDSCSEPLPAYFVTVYWIFSSMAMLFSFAFMYYALKPTFAEISAKISAQRMRQKSATVDMKIVPKFPRIMGYICSPAKHQRLWKSCILKEREIPEQERLWKFWDYQHLIYFFSYRLYFQDLDIIKNSLRDLLYDKFLCHICSSRFHQLDHAFIHPVLLYLSHVDCILKNPTGMNPNLRYKFWQSMSERFRTLHDNEVKQQAAARSQPGELRNIPVLKDIRRTELEMGGIGDTDRELKHRLSLLGNSLSDWLAEFVERLSVQEPVNSTKPPEPETVSQPVKPRVLEIN